GGGGDAGDLFGILIWLAIEHPAIGLPLLIVAAVGYFMLKQKAGNLDWDSGGGGGPAFHHDPGPAARPRAASLEALRAVDPDFSQILFEDFVYRLYAGAHQARADAQRMAELAPYLEPQVREAMARRVPAGVPIQNVVVGAMRVLRVSVANQGQNQGSPVGNGAFNPATGEPESEVEVEFEANVTAVPAGGPAQGYYLWERWLLRRPGSVRTPPPERARSLSCPNCGGPFRSADAQRCDYCGEVVTDGRFDWRVIGIQERNSQQRPPALTSTVAEVGTNLPSVRDRALAQEWSALVAADPAVVPAQLEARVHLIYQTLNQAWTARDLGRDLGPARGLLSEGMADYLRYWIEAYLREGLVNRLDGMQITGLELVKVRRDRWYDAITYRVWATGLDYTVRADSGQVVSGHPHRPRAYSEYWTLI
ncbi:MAG: TIM44-like domain-containing protein, partial [Myxococcales bacterium]|nr:TIM44-like domain-containing protein [Myxococcales bacterium]